MTWVAVPHGSPFGVHTLPYGVFSTERDGPRVGAALGDHVIDLAAVAGQHDGVDPSAFRSGSLNAFMERGPRMWAATRDWLTRLVTEPGFRVTVEPHLLPTADVVLHLPFEVADYVDFYASQQHAENVGKLFRPERPGLPTAWRLLPIGYHGRAGTVVVSGTEIIRPRGLRAEGDTVSYGPSGKLDIETEVGFVVGVPSVLGRPVPVRRFAEHVFGVVLVNDWSARDIQALEYVPLGPFLGKSFATSISAWVVPLAALQHARLEPPPQAPEPAEYLREVEPWGLDITLEVSWNGTTVSRPAFRDMYWTAAQQLAHLTANGASVRTGDLYASGTVSGPSPEQFGSFLELTWNGARPVHLADGSTRTFLRDGDRVTITASAPGPGGSRVGFGEVTGTIRPALR